MTLYNTDYIAYVGTNKVAHIHADDAGGMQLGVDVTYSNFIRMYIDDILTGQLLMKIEAPSDDGVTYGRFITYGETGGESTQIHLAAVNAEMWATYGAGGNNGPSEITLSAYGTPTVDLRGEIEFTADVVRFTGQGSLNVANTGFRVSSGADPNTIATPNEVRMGTLNNGVASTNYPVFIWNQGTAAGSVKMAVSI
jgi:hypothetical protein